MEEDVYWKNYATRFKTFPALLPVANPHAFLAVCIPVYAEEFLTKTLDSLFRCALPEVITEVILLFNKNDAMSEKEKLLHQMVWGECLDWVAEHQRKGLRFCPVYLDAMPDSKGGVGWARKLVLDEAARRVPQEGVMLCLDADCIVEENYLNAVWNYFSTHASCDAASIYYEHDLEEVEEVVCSAITLYELHLRYLVHAYRWCGHPHAYQTVGSSMAVRRKAYLAQGGMNTRQAGEDFYFLQKFIEVGTLHEIKETCVYPSARISNRVPFGTGRAMKQLLDEPSQWMTTALVVFEEIKILFDLLDKLYLLSKDHQRDVYNRWVNEEALLSIGVRQYLESIDFHKECCQIATHTASLSSFKKRFFKYFNAFRMIKYTHYMRDHYYSDVRISEPAQALSKRMSQSPLSLNTAKECLAWYRARDKS